MVLIEWPLFFLSVAGSLLSSFFFGAREESVAFRHDTHCKDREAAFSSTHHGYFQLLFTFSNSSFLIFLLSVHDMRAFGG